MSHIVPFDTSLLLLKRGMVAPLHDASVMGLSLGLLNERLYPEMEQTRRRFQAVADLFEDEMHAYGLSMLVRAAHTDGETERAKTYVMRAIARIAADERLESSIREERVRKIKILLDDFPAS